MKTGINIKKEIEKTTFLIDRTPRTTSEEESKAFSRLSNYRDGGIFAGGFSGESPWECHPQGDEVLQVLSGSAEITILNDSTPEVILLTEGTLLVVSKGKWHKINAPQGVTLITITPQPTTISVDTPT